MRSKFHFHEAREQTIKQQQHQQTTKAIIMQNQSQHRLPTDLIIIHLLPRLTSKSLINLSSSCKELHAICFDEFRRRCHSLSLLSYTTTPINYRKIYISHITKLCRECHDQPGFEHPILTRKVEIFSPTGPYHKEIPLRVCRYCFAMTSRRYALITLSDAQRYYLNKFSGLRHLTHVNSGSGSGSGAQSEESLGRGGGEHVLSRLLKSVELPVDYVFGTVTSTTETQEQPTPTTQWVLLEQVETLTKSLRNNNLTQSSLEFSGGGGCSSVWLVDFAFWNHRDLNHAAMTGVEETASVLLSTSPSVSSSSSSSTTSSLSSSSSSYWIGPSFWGNRRENNVQLGQASMVTTEIAPSPSSRSSTPDSSSSEDGLWEIDGV